MKPTLLAALALLVLLCAGCRDNGKNDWDPAQFQPITLLPIASETALGVEAFTPQDMIHVRPSISSNPEEYTICIAFTRDAVERWMHLAEGIEFICSTPRGPIGRAKVEHFMGEGKAGYCVQILYPDEKALYQAVQQLRPGAP